MRLIRSFLILLGIAFVLYSTAARRSPAPLRVDPETYGYAGGLKSTFYYTEAGKAAGLYGDFKTAIELYNKVISMDSLHSPSYFELANIYSATDLKKALELSEKAHRLDTTNVWYEMQLGRLMVMNEEYDKAYKIYSKLVKTQPNNPNNYRILAALHHQNKEPFSAIAVLDDAETKLGRIEELGEFKRELLIEVKLFDKAIAESEALLRDFPFSEENYVILGQLYAAAKKDSSAIATFNEGLNINPNSTVLLSSLSDFYKEKGDEYNFLQTSKKIFRSPEVDVAAKIKFFNTLTSGVDYYRAHYFDINDIAAQLSIMYPENSDIFKLYTDHLLATGSVDQALMLFKSRLDSPKPPLEMFNKVIDIEAFKERPDSVAKYSDMALKAYPKSAELYIRNGGSLYHMKKEAEAIKSYETALKYAESDSIKSMVYLILGDHYYQKTNIVKTFSYYEKALKLDPDNSAALNNYAYYLTVVSTSKAKLEKALAMSEKSNRLSPSNGTYLDTQAWALYKLGRYAEAKKVMQQALSLDSRGSAELFIHYGDILYELKDYFMASVYWNKALEKGYKPEIIEERMAKIKDK